MKIVEHIILCGDYGQNNTEQENDEDNNVNGVRMMARMTIRMSMVMMI